MIMSKKYLCWKEDLKGSYISEDRILIAPNIKYVFSILANEEGIKYNNERILLRLPNGDVWFAKILSKS